MASLPFELKGKRVFVAGHRGMVGSAVARASRRRRPRCSLARGHHPGTSAAARRGRSRRPRMRSPKRRWSRARPRARTGPRPRPAPRPRTGTPARTAPPACRAGTRDRSRHATARPTALPGPWRRPLRAAGVVVEPMDTGAACRTYNILASEGRNVVLAALVEPHASM